MNLLLFKVNQLGEDIVFVPVVQQLRRMFPQAGITVFTSTEAAPLFRGALGANRVIATDRAKFNASWRNPLSFLRYWLAARTTRARACLIAGDQGAVAHGLAQLTVGSIRVGSAEITLPIPTGVTHPVCFPRGAKIATWHWETGRALAAALDRFDWPLQPRPPDFSHLVAPRTTARRCVVIHAGASLPYGNWPLENFAALAHRLSADHDVVWVDAPNTRGATTTPFEDKLVPCDTLAELASRLAQASLFVGNHSAALQMAAALGCPGVVLAGPTHPEWDPAWHEQRFKILRAPGLACLPCQSHEETPNQCRNEQVPQACMRHWTVDEVERHCRDWMDQQAHTNQKPEARGQKIELRRGTESD